MNELRDVFTKYKAVVFFDTETTGLEAESCQIIELAAIRVEKTERGTLRMADSADVFVKLPEGERIPQKIVELEGVRVRIEPDAFSVPASACFPYNHPRYAVADFVGVLPSYFV